MLVGLEPKRIFAHYYLWRKEGHGIADSIPTDATLRQGDAEGQPHHQGEAVMRRFLYMTAAWSLLIWAFVGWVMYAR